ncbi:MAG: DUF3565 domain-containing protein [Calditrichia bacterium]
MERKIVRFHKDEAGDWIVDLDCGHSRHMRHDPPWSNMNWIYSSESRYDKMGEIVDCRDCDSGLESPENEQKSSEPKVAKQSIEDSRDLRVAATVKSACLKAVIEIYQEALADKLTLVQAAEQTQNTIAALDISKLIDDLPK